MTASMAGVAEKVPVRDDLMTVCAISLLAWIFADASHEGLGHGLTALLTGAQSGVVSTVAWSSAYHSRLVAAGGSALNLIEAGLLWILLRRSKQFSPQTRFFLWACCAFCLLTATGYFFFSGVSNFGDWAEVIAGTHPHWLWQALLAVVGVVSYFFSMRALGAALARRVGVSSRDRSRLRALTLLPYISAFLLSLAGGLLNPEGVKLVLVSALPAAAGGNCGLIWLWHFAPSDAAPAESREGIRRSYAWIGAAAVLSLGFILILGRGIALHR